MSQKKSDEEVVIAVRTSNKELYREIINRYQVRLFTYARYITGDEDKAKDAVQETFIKAYRNLNSFDASKKFSSWIYRITHNEAINIVKKYKRETALPDESKLPMTEDGHIEKLLEQAEHNQNIRQLIEMLPMKYKEAIVLYFIEEKSYEEISDILRIPMGTVGIRILRAKEKLRALLSAS